MLMANWNAELLQAQEIDRSRRGPLSKPFGAYCRSVSSDTEEANFDYVGNESRTLTIIHPFNSTGSWLRCQPEPGAAYVATFRHDEARPQLIQSFHRGPQVRLDAYKDQTGLYRPLYPGEIDLVSAGWAGSFYSRRPRQEHVAGVLKRWMDQDRLLVADRSLVHQKQLFKYSSKALGDEYRLGLVSRPKSSWETIWPKYNDTDYAAEEYLDLKNPSEGGGPDTLFRVQRGHVLDLEGAPINQTSTGIPLRKISSYFTLDDSATTHEIDEQGNVFIGIADSASEGYEIDIPSGSYKKTVGVDETITVLGNRTDSVEGTLVKDVGENYIVTVGTQFLQTNTDTNHVFAQTAASQTLLLSGGGHSFILDDNTNTIYLIASQGGQIHLDGDGSLKILAKSGDIIYVNANEGAVSVISSKGSFLALDDKVTVSDSSGSTTLLMDGSGTLQVTAGSTVLVNAPSVQVDAGSVTLGRNASMSAVIGEKLADLFDKHTHGTGTGPSTPPLPPNTATLFNTNPVTSFLADKVKLAGNI